MKKMMIVIIVVSGVCVVAVLCVTFVYISNAAPDTYSFSFILVPSAANFPRALNLCPRSAYVLSPGYAEAGYRFVLGIEKKEESGVGCGEGRSSMCKLCMREVCLCLFPSIVLPRNEVFLSGSLW